MNQEIQGLSKQQLKSRETRTKIFQAAKRILQKQGYEQLSIKISAKKPVSPMEVFYHHFKTKMIFFLIILKNSRVWILIS